MTSTNMLGFNEVVLSSFFRIWDLFGCSSTLMIKRCLLAMMWMCSPGDHWRVDGLISVARAFGDKNLKDHISARPDLADIVIDLSCEFLILGSNGLWAVFSNQEVVDYVHKIRDPSKSAQDLVAEARNRHSEDDISCIVIQFSEL